MNNKKMIGPLGLVVVMLMFMGCAKYTVKTEKIEVQKNWFDISERYSFPDFEGETIHHSFFDLEPKIDRQSRELYFVRTTRMHAPFGYHLDLMSGKIYRGFRYCKEKDVWEKTGKTLHRPPVSYGFVPQLIDTSGAPQHILAFGKNRYFHKFNREVDIAQKVRVVGGVIHQYCDQFPCQSKQRWLSRIVLVAVNPKDPTFSQVRTLKELKEQVNWEHVIAFLENSYGRNVALATQAPAYKVSAEVSADKALEGVEKNGLRFDQSEQQTMQRSCHALYNYLWFSSERIRKNIRLGKEDKLSNISLYEGDEWERKRIDSFLKDTKTGLPNGANKNFAVFLSHFIESYGSSFQTCSRYVRDSNINIDPQRHWFIAQVRLFLQLEELGYTYICDREAWVPNPLTSMGERTFDNTKQWRQCSVSQMDEAFSTGLTLYAGLRSTYRSHHRYIQYDSVYGGSHQKIYNWVKDDGKRLSCDVEDPQIMKAPIFPEDVSWREFGYKKKRELYQTIR